MSTELSGGEDEAGEPLKLDKALLLAVLGRQRVAASLEELRRDVAALQHSLADPTAPLRQPEGEDAIRFPAGYLEEELEQIGAAQTLERARYYVERLVKSITDTRTSPVNDINLNRWKAYDDILTDSLWNFPRRDSSSVHNAGYWGNFIPQIPHQMMRRYTRKGEWVLDTFAGSGTTLIEARRLGRHSLGVELQSGSAARARELIDQAPNPHHTVAEVVEGDSSTIDFRELLERHGRSSVQLLMMHPPYFDIIKFSDDPRDLSNAGSSEQFLAQMGLVIDNAARVLDAGRYLALVIGDKYARREWIPLGFQTMQAALERGFLLKSIVVKNFETTTGKRTQKELWRYRALVGGFYVFKHEYIFVLQKRG